MPRLPDNSQHIAIVGRNGTGKSRAALWHLSTKDLSNQKWVIIDYKREPDFGNIETAKYIGFDDDIKENGVYIIQPMPNQVEEMDAFLYKIHAQENMGVLVDEGYMLRDNEVAFNALLTQGRSKRIPLIVLSQRPSWISRFVFSESTFYQVFALNDRRDRKTVTEFIDFGEGKRDYRNVNSLPPFHSWYYDVGEDSLIIAAPVPDLDETMESINTKLAPPKKKSRWWL